jgi:hypothetical protein
MKCKDIERLVIESSSERQDRSRMAEVEKHIEHCAACARLKEDLENMRNVLERMPQRPLPEDLDKKTYQMCRAELKTLLAEGKPARVWSWSRSIPTYIKVALISLLVLTVLWTASLLRDFRLEESLSVSTIIVLSLIIQNAMMLLFAPLLLRRFRSKKSQFENLFLG